MAASPQLTPDQQQSIIDSGGYYDSNNNWVDMSGTSMGNSPSRPAQSGGGGINPLAGILATLGSAYLGHTLSANGAQNAVPPELRQMLQMGLDRQAYQNPLFQANTQGTYQMLPGFAKAGTSLSGTLSNTPPAAPTDASGSGSSPYSSLNPLTNPILAALAGYGASDAAKGQIPFQSIIDGLKKLFQHNTTVQGNKPYPGGALNNGQQNGAFPFLGWPSNNGNEPPDNFTGPRSPFPNVDTSINFNNDPTLGAYYPPDYSTLPGYGTPLPGVPSGGGEGSGPTGTDWWDE